MNFYEVETWRPRLSCPAEEYEKAIENWFTYVTEKKELFPGLISAKYFNKCDREANPDGYYMMILFTLIAYVQKQVAPSQKHSIYFPEITAFYHMVGRFNALLCFALSALP